MEISARPALRRGRIVGTAFIAVLFLSGLSGCHTDPAKLSTEQLLVLANPYSPKSMVELGDRYAQGLGVRKSAQEAASSYATAAKRDYPEGEYKFGLALIHGRGVPKDPPAGFEWVQKAANQNYAPAIATLGYLYLEGIGVTQDYAQALALSRKAAEQEEPAALYNLGLAYLKGLGAPADPVQGISYLRRSADHGFAPAMLSLGYAYRDGVGVDQDPIIAYAMFNLAAARALNDDDISAKAAKQRDATAQDLTPAQLEMGQRLARDWAPGTDLAKLEDPALKVQAGSSGATADEAGRSRTRHPASTGTGFAINAAGDLRTNAHVVAGCRELRALLPGTSLATTLIASDATNDAAILRLPAPPAGHVTLRSGKPVRQGDAVVIYGFPLAGLVADGNLTTGTVTALAGLHGDARFYQVSAPIQPGNSGSPMVDEQGLLIGLINSAINSLALAKQDIPTQNINFAIKGDVVRSFLDANQIAYDTAASALPLKTPDITDRLRKYTYKIECYH